MISSYTYKSWKKIGRINFITSLQNVFILLPLIYLIAYTLHSLILKLKPVCCSKKESNVLRDNNAFLQVIDNRDQNNYELLQDMTV